MEPQDNQETPAPFQPGSTIAPESAPVAPVAPAEPTETTEPAPPPEPEYAVPAEPVPTQPQTAQNVPMPTVQVAEPVPVPQAAPSAIPQPQATTQPPAQPMAGNPKQHVPNILPVTEPGEHTLCVIKRHRIGIMGVYVASGLGVLVTAVLTFLVIPGFAGANKGTALLAGFVIFLVVAAVAIGFAMISAKVYWGNTWTLTTDSLTQVKHLNLFSRQSSQLSLKDLEDVTAEQNGVLPEMFNYGLLRVETAGERSKFMFPFCPNPNYYAQQILAAREAFERNRSAEEDLHSKTP